MDDDDELEEERRLMYVALTRPRRHLGHLGPARLRSLIDLLEAARAGA